MMMIIYYTNNTNNKLLYKYIMHVKAQQGLEDICAQLREPPVACRPHGRRAPAAARDLREGGTGACRLMLLCLRIIMALQMVQII